MDSNALVLIVVVVLVGGALVAAAARTRRGARDGARGERKQYGAAYRELVRAVRGDRACADRLVEYERGEAPGATRAELAQRALRRLARDRGR